MGLWGDLLRVLHGLDPRVQPESATRPMRELTQSLDARRISGMAEATMIADDRLKWGALVPLAIEALGDTLEDFLNQ